MDIYTVCKLLGTYGACPKCGNKYLGDGEGTLEVNETSFKRTCKCGFEINIDNESEEI
ncbi:DUF3797 domain-containing protein [Clostridium cadaveris]|uniref:DUF3797 domain-containing protein n=1 Tax=Clostridium cadaveris TaxID=1529 RepID=UPI000C07C1B3|nr:DUF3797 domain-containing protein [Clostridium cadaveris]